MCTPSPTDILWWIYCVVCLNSLEHKGLSVEQLLMNVTLKKVALELQGRCVMCLYLYVCISNTVHVTLQCPADRTLQNGADCNNGQVIRCLCVLNGSPQSYVLLVNRRTALMEDVRILIIFVEHFLLLVSDWCVTCSLP